MGQDLWKPPTFLLAWTLGEREHAGHGPRWWDRTNNFNQWMRLLTYLLHLVSGPNSCNYSDWRNPPIKHYWININCHEDHKN